MDVINRARHPWMPNVPDRSLAVWCFAFLLLLSACGENKLECDSIDTRNAVLQRVADDHRNPLVNYAAKESTAKPNPENSKPLYLLSERMVTTSTSPDKRTLQCSGGISVSVGDVKASKEIEFTVQRASDGKISVSVVPFQF
ncbi:hypothetical protein [Bradyrhizobium ivorense]|nr:hypothetical protein [Bradyrhizobium ivorense]